MSIPDPNSIDGAIRHALQLLRQHSESYVEEIVVEPSVWRSRYNDLKQDLACLEFVRDTPLL